MNREMQDSQAKAVLPPGFWSQAPSDQLQRLEQLLQQFLSLPGFQQGTGTAGAQVQSVMLTQGRVNPPVSASPCPGSHPAQAASSSPSAGWTPSGSTWGPLAEAWKQVQHEKQTIVPNAESPPIRFSAPVTTNPPPSLEIPGNFSWQFPEDPGEKTAPIAAWNLAGLEESTPWRDSGPVQETVLPTQEFQTSPTHLTASKGNHPGVEKASIPVQAGWGHKTLVFGNRVVDASLRRLGWPGRGLQSSLGKWFLGLTGVCLLTGGTWLYFREAVDELVGQIGFGEMAPP